MSILKSMLNNSHKYSCSTAFVSHYYSFLQQTLIVCLSETQHFIRCCRSRPQSGRCGTVYRGRKILFMEHLLCIGHCDKHFICITYFNSYSDRMDIIVCFIHEETVTENCNKSLNTKKLTND